MYFCLFSLAEAIECLPVASERSAGVVSARQSTAALTGAAAPIGLALWSLPLAAAIAADSDAAVVVAFSPVVARWHSGCQRSRAGHQGAADAEHGAEPKSTQLND